MTAPSSNNPPDEVAPAASSAAGYPSEKVQVNQQMQNAKYTRQGNPDMARLTGREKEFEELGDLTALYEGLSAKTRQHVNPLADHFQVPTTAPDWKEVFADPTLPLQIDVGCGAGRFVLIRAQRMAGISSVVSPSEAALAADPDTTSVAAAPAKTGKVCANVLGMEIRQKLVERAQAWKSRLQLPNCHFIFTNATVSWRSLLERYPGPIELVSMQFPDPHFKTRHHKRRHVQPRLVEEMAQTLAPGAQVFLQGDVPEAVRWMRDMIEAHGNGSFALAAACRNQPDLMREEWETVVSGPDGPPDAGDAADAGAKADTVCGAQSNNALKSEQKQLPLAWSADASAGWLAENPLGVPSEREIYVAQLKTKVYRVMLTRV